MPKVPYTTPATLSESDREYLGNRVSKGAAISQFLGIGEVIVNQRQLVAKLDDDTGLTDSAVTTGDPKVSYSKDVLDEDAT